LKALSELDKLSGELFLDGLDTVARFIRNEANYMVTFAKLSIKGICVPRTNKHKWMHWSTKGLENLLNILLAGYCNRRVYGEMKERYLSPNTTQIQVAVT
jgi:hypothetical protein